MSRTVFILGAGASAQGGAPLMANFLDVAEHIGYGDAGGHRDQFQLVFSGIAALQPVYAKGYLDLDNLESVFAAFEMAALCGELAGWSQEQLDRLGPALRLVIAHTLDTELRYPIHRGRGSQQQVYAPEPYTDFAQLLGHYAFGGSSAVDPSSVASVITFNYDLALDYACHVLQLPVDYRLDGAEDGRRLDLLKLHGSLNWVECSDKDCPGIVPWHLGAFFRARDWNLMYYGDETKFARLSVLGLLNKFQPHGKTAATEPFIVPPTWSKTQYHRGIANVWRAAARHLGAAENIFVIGYSLPETDHFFRYLYSLGTLSATRLKRFWVFDPDASGGVQSRFEQLLGAGAKRRFAYHRQTFEQALDTVRTALNVPRIVS